MTNKSRRVIEFFLLFSQILKAITNDNTSDIDKDNSSTVPRLKVEGFEYNLIYGNIGTNDNQITDKTQLVDYAIPKERSILKEDEMANLNSSQYCFSDERSATTEEIFASFSFLNDGDEKENQNEKENENENENEKQKENNVEKETKPKDDEEKSKSSGTESSLK